MRPPASSALLVPARRAALSALALLLLLGGCGGDERGSLTDLAGDDIVDAVIPADADAIELYDGTSGDADAADTGGPCEGCLGSPCAGADDCLSGYCVQGPDGRWCSKTCSDTCPTGWSCLSVSGGVDVAFICVYGHTEYCMPCDADAECANPLNPTAGNRCVASEDGSGAFCATACAADSECPDGARCQGLEVDRASQGVCRPEAGAACTCSRYATSLAASTTCAKTNAAGRCEGARLCTEAGLTACDAATPAREACNGEDDDCDGATDEDFPALGSPCDGPDDADDCADGAWACAEDGGIACVGDGGVARVEICNGLDDDCDGETDEGVAGVGAPCDGPDEDDCKDGVMVCVDGGLACDDDAASHAEVCNGVDDDCDGLIDGEDGSLVLAACARQEGVCAGSVASPERCQEGQWLPCDDADYAAISGYEAEVELSCDGADNDCDGATDEDFALTLRDGSVVEGAGAACGSGGCAGGVTVCNAAGDGLSCPSEDGGSAETCNGVDDDCDGLTDGADPDLPSPLCAQQLGVCAGARAPRALCSGGAWVSCSDALYAAHDAAYQGGVELLCDGADNDCDGATDEDFVATMPDGATFAGVGLACGVGACAGGFTVCAGPNTTRCSTAGNARAEVCDGVDNDCDGLVDGDDPDLQLVPCDNQLGVCEGAMRSAARCVGGAWLGCTSADYEAHAPAHYAAGAEVRCDGFDDDCDGRVDDDFAVTTPDGAVVRGAGVSCGAGVCRGGVSACNAAGDGLVCPTLASATAEICDGEDNDCDGLLDAADPSLDLALCGKQLGVCLGARAPAARCVGGAWAACEPADYHAASDAYDGAAELRCDGRDNDCDGRTDEDFALTLDDGSVVTGAQRSCGAGACEGGYTACNAAGDGIVCDSEAQGGVEVCDGEDNDCDGLTDGDDPDLVAIPCDVQAGLCLGSMRPARLCADGAWQACDAAAYSAHDPRYEAGVEATCDGLDNDCDAAIDEDFALTEPGGGVVSGVGKGCGVGACAGGVSRCAPARDGVVCSTDGGGSAEVCDGEDNDCDGLVDGDDPELVLALCDEQRGVCAGARHVAAECVGGAFGACPEARYAEHAGAARQAGAELLCDALDNDCDGATDEDFELLLLDESVVSGVGASCGVGACGGGVTVCAASGGGIVCDREAGASPEVCNGVDDDCDGLVDGADPDLLLEPCERQLGVCEGATKPAALCVDGAWRACGDDLYAAGSADYSGGGELRCDGLDNDCDGATDEDFSYQQLDGALVTGAGEACGVGACAGGLTACDEAGTGLICAAEAGARAETCDGVDNDCDGLVDADDNDLVAAPCEVQAGVCAGASRPARLCVAGAWGGCDAAAYAAHDERYHEGSELGCDGADDDCDGATDEDFALTLLDGRVVHGVGASCGVGACAGGVTACDASGSGIACPSQEAATLEECNGVDDDCDGAIDAADGDLGRVPCDEQRGVCLGATRLPARCVAGSWEACGAEDYAAAAGALYEHGAELSCDGRDNDCDGATDDDFAYVAPSGVSSGVGEPCGVGACAGGTVVCAGAPEVTCTTANRAAAELCDDLDQDCDGVTDGGCDDDGDGWCDVALGVVGRPASCPQGAGDCDDTVASTHPGADERCNAVDDDCDGATDEAFVGCAAASCAAVDADHYQATAADACSAGECVTPAFHGCGLFTCVGGGEVGDRCAESCSSDAECVASAHCDETRGLCAPDVPDGGGCIEGSDCAGGHCQNGFCCEGGDCCALASQCPASYDRAPACDAAATCQGTRRDRACVDHVCAVGAAVPDDRGCLPSVVSHACPAGYPPAMCVGGAEQGTPSCPAGCDGDDDCVTGYHCDGTCLPDVPDGGACDEASDCASAHCQNGFCCGDGDCCASGADCPAGYAAAPACDVPGECAGHRLDRTCVAARCGSSAPIADDRGCGAEVEANSCGHYESVFCTGAAEQPVPTCPTTCASDDDCDEGAHCDGTCVPDLPDGSACVEASDCVSAHCQNGFCCAGGDCCATAASCPPRYSGAPVCELPAVCRGDKAVATCVASVCGTQEGVRDDAGCTADTVAQECGPYRPVFCPGGSLQTAPSCATGCSDDSACDPGAYCNAAGHCVDDEPDGHACRDDAECQGGHCGNGFCCASGDCCSRGSDCPSELYATPSACRDAATCEGARRDPRCTAASQCQLGPEVDDDTGCGGLEANLCGLYPSVYCLAIPSQTAPPCATSCGPGRGCDAGAFCDDGVCAPVAGAGGECETSAACAGGLTCVDGVCCTSSCTGGCRRCDLTGDGVCHFIGAGADPDAECGGFDCSGWYLGFDGNTCFQPGAISDAVAACDGLGACQTRSQLCPQQLAQGPPTSITCDATCQRPRAGSCAGPTPGACDNVGAGTISCGYGVCHSEVPACVNGSGNACQPGPPRDEVCNRLDDDCDQLTDAADAADLLAHDGRLCEKQAGICLGAAKPAGLCVEGQWAACATADYQAHDPRYAAGAEAACDGLDDDCDAATDEDFLLNLPDGTQVRGVGQGCGVGACVGGHTRCAAGGAGIECSTAGLASIEVCNGADDDCDGLVDGADASVVRPFCELQQGVCRGALKPVSLCGGASGWGACGAAAYAAFTSAYDPGGAELRCDGADNDCDGQTDEDFVLTLPSGTAAARPGDPCGVGACAGGTAQCNGAGTGLLCSSAGSAGVEICDGVDNDCDGLVDGADPDLQRVACDNQLGVCAGALKPVSLCVGGAWRPCDDGDYLDHSARYEPGRELSCDGVDNDCSGQTDEDFDLTLLSGVVVHGAGASCGAGVCSGGVTVCTADQAGLLCPTEVNAGGEVCDGIDNDCDGKIDANDGSLAVVPCDNQQGVCAGAQRPPSACVGGHWQGCESAVYAAHAGASYQPGLETRCDGLDNDCDGHKDEDFRVTMPDGQVASGVGASCGVGACAGGTTACNGAQDGTVCSSAGNARQEVCGGGDDDCDGLVDAADASLELPLCDKQAGVCAGSRKVASLCAAGRWQPCGSAQYTAWTSLYEAAESRCDAKDNDCDGGTDNGLTAPLNPVQLGDCAGTRQDCRGASGFAPDYRSVPLYGLNETPDGAFRDENCDGIDGTVALGVFVAPSGSDSGTCTKGSPCRTLAYALGRVSAGRPHVYIQAGTYSGVVNLVNYAQLYGGFDAGWVRAARTADGHGVTLTGGGVYGSLFMTVRAASVGSSGAPVTLADLSVIGPDASGTLGSRGRSSHAIYALSSVLTVERVTVTQGNGSSGGGGYAGGGYSTSDRAPGGAKGGNASQGISWCSTDRQPGGAGASYTCGSGGTGGQGGTKDSGSYGPFGGLCHYDATSGYQGYPTGGSCGATGRGGCGGGTCNYGGTGGAGAESHGSGGAAAVAAGKADSSYLTWSGTQGGAGSTGSNGGGGGGGGGSGGCDTGTDAQGAGGGGGGAGGCAAWAAGSGGYGAGGSFGVFGWGSVLTVRSSTFVRGVGGAGGPGGPGARGMAGGWGGAGGDADAPAKTGGWGGTGGTGGHSGGGGGGGGGHSYAIYTVGGAAPTATGNSYSAGGAGSGGSGGGGVTSAQNGSTGAAGSLGTVGACTGACLP